MTILSEKELISFGAIEKIDGEENMGQYPYSITRATYEKHDDDPSGVRLYGGIGIYYPVENESLLRVDENTGTIEFDSYDGTYRLRKLSEEDFKWFSLYSIPLSPQMMEDIMEKDNEVGVEESVEGFSNAKTGEVVAIAYTVKNLGRFFRRNGKWEAGEDFAGSLDDTTVTPIAIKGAQELISKWDLKEKLTEADLDSYASPQEDTE